MAHFSRHLAPPVLFKYCIYYTPRRRALRVTGCPRSAACPCWVRGARRGPCVRCAHLPRLHRLGPGPPPFRFPSATVEAV